ncbi:MAG: hypothetical protein CMM62_03920 [Rhodospirillaceae bacterium]|nr:hypothetical protein [Rhodospirillaceae bacterium]MAX62411.1 hypothetical protein [Rhodospirillaceae bacterium]
MSAGFPSGQGLDTLTPMKICGRFTYGLIALLAGVACLLSYGAGPAVAQSQQVLVPVDGKDPVDGSQLIGVRLTAEDGKAFLFFLCDGDNTNPRVIFGHGAEINKPTKPMAFDVTIDGGETRRHYFAVLPNTRSALFFARTAQMYEDRFGTSPEVFNEQTRAVNPDYIAWTDNIYNQLIADFFFGRRATVQFTDVSGQSHIYSFQLALLAENIGRLQTCYEAPRVY